MLWNYCFLAGVCHLDFEAASSAAPCGVSRANRIVSPASFHPRHTAPHEGNCVSQMRRRWDREASGMTHRKGAGHRLAAGSVTGWAVPCLSRTSVRGSRLADLQCRHAEIARSASVGIVRSCKGSVAEPPSVTLRTWPARSEQLESLRSGVLHLSLRQPNML